MKKLTFYLLLLINTSCTLLTPSVVKIINSSKATIIVESKSFMNTLVISSKKSTVFEVYPGEIEFTIREKDGLYSEAHYLSVGYLEAIEINYTVSSVQE
ncbi:MAG: hypothetical protein A2015_13080 [Spirochaetes bacterium GWF1_31_7]|nr:MAG: hypothetical protein A2Y30_00485 [Spirochaetes bacterium GWE1_32_154]OHD51318.1 MAG: hypothetical protein A2Y29_00930 [Spirochaetes bacterium GWE2_31_10]OHD51515.1 MAG: hypothetical protein A2015_13080 [Spirochaetes bacterium GWF1_31_7]OHD81795.1 MAG: hypothetical protein A2355_04595 [Spirochaetes bacterium RIFOXYB1_FULL_32_8]HBD95864.1 hypothetical protein [Spirochaetia bacterium]